MVERHTFFATRYIGKQFQLNKDGGTSARTAGSRIEPMVDRRAVDRLRRGSGGGDSGASGSRRRSCLAGCSGGRPAAAMLASLALRLIVAAGVVQQSGDVAM